jgi:hypothetical protein
MAKFKFNDKQGNRDRSCQYGFVSSGVFYTSDEAIEKKMATMKQISHEKCGKWSNSTWEVVVNTAVPVVIMRPFDGWAQDMKTCVEHVQTISEQYTGMELSAENAEIAFKDLYPEKYAWVQEAEEACCKLI